MMPAQLSIHMAWRRGIPHPHHPLALAAAGDHPPVGKHRQREYRPSGNAAIAATPSQGIMLPCTRPIRRP